MKSKMIQFVKSRTRLILPALLALMAPYLFAQTAQISGQVTDPSGKVVPGVSIAATNMDTGLRRAATTNDDGYYLMAAMQPGEYEVTAAKEGFKTLSQTGLRLVTDARLRVDFKLALGAVSQSITVADTAGERVDLDTGSVGRMVDGEQAREIALNGRNLVQLMMLMPGVATTTDDFSTGTTTYNGSVANFIVNGQRAESTNVTVDGGSNTDNGSSVAQTNAVSVEFVREVKMSAGGYSAEYGRNGGAQVNFATRSGSAEYHGALLEFFRNDKLNARSFFAPATKDKLRLNNFGWNLGGPLLIPRISSSSHKTLFFFAGQEYKRRVDGATFRLTLPTRAERSGVANTTTVLRYPSNFPVEALRGSQISDPSRATPGNSMGLNILPRQYMTANGQGVMKIYDALESMAVVYSDQPAANNATFQTPYSDVRRQDLVKVDYQPLPKHRFAFRYLYDVGNYVNPRGYGATPTFNLTRDNTAQNLQFTWTYVISAQALNEVALGSNHLRLLNYGSGALSKPQTYGMKIQELFGNDAETYGLPGINVSGYSGITGSLVAGSPMWTGSVTDNFSLLRGKHTLKFGGLFQRDRKNTWNFSIGSITFNQGGNNLYTSGLGLIDALLGNYQQRTEVDKLQVSLTRFSTGEAYAADTWKATRRLTLDMGLRFTYSQAPYEAANNASTFVPETYNPAAAQRVIATGALAGRLETGVGQRYNGIVTAGDGYGNAQTAPTDPAARNLFRDLPRGFFPDQKRFSPRLGFAYDVFGNGKLAVRAGSGVTYERIPIVIATAAVNPPFVNSITLYNGNWDDPLGGTASEFPVAVGGTRLNRVASAMYNWNFGVQRQLPFGSLLDVNYVSTQGRRLLRTPNINQVSPAEQYPNRSLNVNAIRPYQGYTNINLQENSASSNYHGLQVGVTRRYASTFTYSVAYTWSKVLTDASAIGEGVENLLNYRAERSHATFDRNHILVFSYVYKLPFFRRGGGAMRRVLGGWDLSGVTQLQSGAWMTPAYSTPTGSRRPDRVGEVQYFDARQVQTLVAGNGQSTTGNFYFDPTPGTTFVAPANDQYGNSAKNIVRGPGRNNSDMSLFKNFVLREGINLQFRGELFNIWNHAQFRNPNMTANDRNYATISDTGPPRVVQFALKLTF